jgi:hypothetical protein
MPSRYVTHATRIDRVARAREMHEIYRAGATLEEVGAEHGGLTRERVRQIFKDADLPTRSRGQANQLKRKAGERYLAEHRKSIIQTFRQTRDLAATAEEHKLPASTLRDMLKETLPRHEYCALAYKPSTPKYTPDELLDFLRTAAADINGRTPGEGAAGRNPNGILTISRYTKFANGRHTADGRRWPTYQTYRNRFGSWPQALHAAEVPANPPRRRWSGKRIDRDECLAAILTVQQKLGKTPTEAEYNKCARQAGGTLPSTATIRNHCGGWIGALQIAGI